MDKEDKKNNRRNFLKNGLTIGGSMLTMGMGSIAAKGKSGNDQPSGEKIKVLTTDGKIIEV
jgi:hypothetical protein